MKSKSASLLLFVKDIDNILSKIHEKNVHGQPLQQLHDEWINARERLMAIKLGNPSEPYFPINWQLAEHLILSELAGRLPGCVEHVEQYRAKMGVVN